MSRKYLFSVLVLVGLSAAEASEPLVCENTLGTRLIESAPSAFDIGNPETIQLEAGEVEAQLGDSQTTKLSGGILLRRVDFQAVLHGSS